MNSTTPVGFTYTVEVLHPDGTRSQREVKHNLMPVEGLNLLLSIGFKALAPPAAWSVGLYEGNYVPQVGDTAATFVAAATECTAYSQATRVPFVPGTVVAGTVDGSASPCSFTFPVAKTIYGGFMSTVSGKGATTGGLMSVVRFDTPKVLDVGAILLVTPGFAFTSV